MSLAEKQVLGELAGLMDRFAGAMHRVVRAYGERRNRERDIYWLALQTTKEFGAMVLHSQFMIRKARAMEPLDSIHKSSEDSWEEAEHYYGYRRILDWYLQGEPCAVTEWWGYGDTAVPSGPGPGIKQSLWPEHYGYFVLAQRLANEATSPWVRDVISSNREGAAVAFHHAMSQLPPSDEFMRRIVLHEQGVAHDELHHGPELLQELARSVPSEEALEDAKQRITQLRIQELRQRNEQFMHVLTPAELSQIEQDFTEQRVEPVALFAGAA